ncbi:MAG TPA: hypothetical protein VMY78_03810 [Solirubrobacteraceae bacterium]|nr:hypothetical protein [Solirubrobacteraceae bacterium]
MTPLPDRARTARTLARCGRIAGRAAGTALVRIGTHVAEAAAERSQRPPAPIAVSAPPPPVPPAAAPDPAPAVAAAVARAVAASRPLVASIAQPAQAAGHRLPMQAWQARRDAAGIRATSAEVIAFVDSELAGILHGQGKRISVAVSATTKVVTTGRAAFYDYAALGAVADTVFVMGWGKHWSTSIPGALADLPWATDVANFVATMPNKGRYVLGAGLYGMDWAAGGGASHPATALEWADVQNLIAAVGASPVIDPVAGAPHFSYVDASGMPHDLWYTDARSMDALIGLAHDRGLGFGVWRLGREEPAIWEHPLVADPSAWPAG